MRDNRCRLWFPLSSWERGSGCEVTLDPCAILGATKESASAAQRRLDHPNFLMR